MFTEMKARKYTKSKRADQQEETRTRIVNATVALHEQIGPANTSIKAVAEKAGVQRLTVYRHFPDEESLLQACSSAYFKDNPPPDINHWADVTDAAKRSHAAIFAFNEYYRRTAGMWNSIYRDIDKVEALKRPMAEFEGYLHTVSDDLLTTWKLRGTKKKRCLITLRHCLQFTTWKSLMAENLQDKQTTELMMSWINQK